MIPYTHDANCQDAARTMRHAEIIRRKPFLTRLYREFYGTFLLAAETVPARGTCVELGSGGGFINEVIPDVITSDILGLPGIDIRFSALQMPFKDGAVRALFMLNTLHHINDAETFFREVDRCLAVGGKCVAVEPANTPFSRVIFRNLHHETFEPRGNWRFESGGPLAGANGALPWIVFGRDRARFETLYPGLRITRITLHTPFRYIFSGGFTLGQLLPSCAFDAVSAIEKRLSPLYRYIAMFQTIEIEKARQV